jgi:hypothetical protein
VTRQLLAWLSEAADSLAGDIARRNPQADAWREATTFLLRLLALAFLEKLPAFSLAVRLDPEELARYRQVVVPLFRHLADPAAHPHPYGRPSVVAPPVPGRELFTLNDTSAGLDIDPALVSALAGLINRFDFTLCPATWVDADLVVDSEVLGTVFENLVLAPGADHDRRKATGSYFTPQSIVEFMCRQALRAFLAETDGLSDDALDRLFDDDPSSPLPFDPPEAARLRQRLATITVVDPAAGAGAFLLGMLGEITELIRRLDQVVGEPGAVERPGYAFEVNQAIIGRCLHGVDLHALAVAICKFRLGLNLMASLPDNEPESHATVRAVLTALDEHLRRGDSLARMAGLWPETGAFSWERDFSDVFIPSSAGRKRRSKGEGGGFDLVITNPPYGAELAGPTGAGPQRDSYVRFIELGTRLARRGGVGCFIVPTSWESGERYQAVRQLLLDRLSLRLVVNLPYDAFPGAYVDNAIILFANRAPEASTTYRAATLPKRLRLTDPADLASRLRPVPLDLVRADPQRRVVFEPLAARLAQRFSGPGFVPLGQITDSTIGILASKYPIRPGLPPGRGWLPYFVGNVYRFQVVQQRLDAVYFPGPQARFHRGPRIAVRRVVSRANRILCAVLDDDFVTKKDLYSFLLRPEHSTEFDLQYLLALLNSALFSYLYLARSAIATRDDFRQLTLTGLRELPVWLAASAQQQLLAELARRLTGLAAEGRTGTLDWEALDQNLETAVFDLYGLSTDERQAVLAWLAQAG